MPTRFNIGTTEWTMVKKEEKRREEKREWEENLLL